MALDEKFKSPRLLQFVLREASVKYYSKPSNSCEDISLKAKKCQPAGGAAGNVRGSPKMLKTKDIPISHSFTLYGSISMFPGTVGLIVHQDRELTLWVNTHGAYTLLYALTTTRC